MIKSAALFTLSATAILSAASASAEPFVLNHSLAVKPAISQKLAPVATPQLRAPAAIACPDIRVVASQTDNPDGSIQVTIKVVNTSGADFVSGPGQQMLQVRGNGREASVPFRNLVRGGEVRFHDTFRPFEFPATYNAVIALDPDILIDGNPGNDDCRTSNNSASLTTHR